MAIHSSVLELIGDTPIIQAPMAGSVGVDLAVAVCEAGGLGSLPAAMLSPDILRDEFVAWVQNSHLLRRAFREGFSRVRSVTTPAGANEVLVGGESILSARAWPPWESCFLSPTDRRYWRTHRLRGL